MHYCYPHENDIVETGWGTILPRNENKLFILPRFMVYKINQHQIIVYAQKYCGLSNIDFYDFFSFDVSKERPSVIVSRNPNLLTLRATHQVRWETENKKILVQLSKLDGRTNQSLKLLYLHKNNIQQSMITGELYFYYTSCKFWNEQTILLVTEYISNH